MLNIKFDDADSVIKLAIAENGASVIHGDCLIELPMLAANSLDACVTDPPYGLSFMGKAWDHGVPGVPFWREVFRVLKPGAHLVAFGGSRTYHRMACAIEDAGFEMRDSLMWVYGSGFPKSQNVSKFIDKEHKTAGTYGAPKSEKHAGWLARGRMRGGEGAEGWQSPWMQDAEALSNAARKYEPGSSEAAEWDGWGTALKPAFEPIVFARKPLSEKTVAANVLRWRTGAINIDGCRVPSGDALVRPNIARTDNNVLGRGLGAGVQIEPAGRFPANVVHDGSAEVLAAFPSTKTNGNWDTALDHGKGSGIYGAMGGRKRSVQAPDSGSAARFFYAAKASKADRAGSKHPTVKPIALMQWLCRLVTPPGGTVLDPFAGSGTTGAAAVREGFDVTLIEREAEYAADIRRRLGLD